MRVRRSGGPGWVIIGVVASLGAGPSGPNPQSLDILPARLRLDGPEAVRRVVVVATFADGSTRDVTTEARLEPTGAVVRVDDRGQIRPVADGAGEVVVRFGGVQGRAAVEVRGASAPRAVSFRNEVAPVLTRLGCNQGACHGSQHGKGGFRLSLLGFEPVPDHTAIVKSAEGRRVTPFAPEESGWSPTLSTMN